MAVGLGVIFAALSGSASECPTREEEVIELGERSAGSIFRIAAVNSACNRALCWNSF